MLKVLSGNSSEYNLDEIVRQGAKEMLVKALNIEVAGYLGNHKDLVDDNGRRLVVGNGKGKGRKVTVGAGVIEVEAPRVNDRREGEKFTSFILPPYLRKSPKIESLLPVLYLRGISTGKMADTLTEFLGAGSMGLSPCYNFKTYQDLGDGLCKLEKASAREKVCVYVGRWGQCQYSSR